MTIGCCALFSGPFSARRRGDEASAALWADRAKKGR